MKHEVALTETARAASSINDKHREVLHLGRSAKEIAAEIGEELIAVKAKEGHGKFMPWVTANCVFSDRSAQDYMKIAKAKAQHAADFKRCDSIRDVLALGKPKPAPEPERRAATLDDLRRVEALQALRDDPAASEGERVNAQSKLDAIEKEIGPVEDARPEPSAKQSREVMKETRLKACTIMDKLSPIMTPVVRAGVISALVTAYKDTPEKLDKILAALNT